MKVENEELQTKISENLKSMSENTTALQDRDSQIQKLNEKIQELENQVRDANSTGAQGEQKLRDEIKDLVQKMEEQKVKENELRLKELAEQQALLEKNKTDMQEEYEKKIVEINQNHSSEVETLKT